MRSLLRYSSLAATAVLCIIGIFHLANYVQGNDVAQSIVERFGFLGMVTIAIIAGFNIFVPLHVASFSPLFIAAGFSLPIIIAALVIGTTISDIVGYYFGIWSRRSTTKYLPHLMEKLENFSVQHRKMLVPGIFLYVSLAPLPNEIFLVPLGLMGLRLQTFIIPLILGNIVNQALFAFGFFHAFNYFF